MSSGKKRVVIAGSGNAALCAGISALEQGADVLIPEKAGVDEGENFRNYTYAQFGREILSQPRGFAWQIFDRKVDDLLYDEYRFAEVSFVEADALSGLVSMLDGANQKKALETIQEFNKSVDPVNEFDPTILDGRRFWPNRRQSRGTIMGIVVHALSSQEKKVSQLASVSSYRT